VNIAALATQVIDDLRSAEPHRRVTVVIADPLAASGDSNLVRVVLDNLLSNAWKFTSKREDAVINVGAVRQDGEQVFFVRDNGAGFDMRYASKLFDPLQRLHRATDFEGNGIGLAIVHRIVSRHGGQVWAEGEPEKGATFFFTLTSSGTNPGKLS